ncbi:dihydrolipoyl dehydrogenase [Mycoplasmopsis adleri]|uniref:dihydrolipoyl dehydrogenase n=1 Tax=Mycoplasmopsis adleri TaxID=51362 RepID=UPI00387370DF
MYKFKFADIGEGLHEGTVGDVFVKEGMKINEGDSLFSVETDKVASDIPSPVSGVVKTVRIKKGDVIHVGDNVIDIDDGSGDSASESSAKPETKEKPNAGGLVDYSFKFADIGEGLHEGTVGDVYVKVNDEVKEGDSLFSVETDKVASDIPGPVSGKIKEIKLEKGKVIHVGDEIFIITTANAPSASAASSVKKEEEKCLVGDAPNSSDLINLNFANSSTKQPETPKQEVLKSSNGTSFVDEDKPLSNVKIDDEFDAIVVGSGPGGYLAAEEAGKSGLKTLIVEKEFWGGVCLNIGCIPTKAMLKSTEIIEDVLHASEYGLVGNFSDLKLDKNKTWIKMHERKAKVVEQISGSVRTLMLSSKCKIEEGKAEFLNAHTIKVNGKVYTCKNMIIATGSHSRKLKSIEGFEEGFKKGKIITSREAINYDKKLPKSMVIIGAGVIGVEFAQVYATAGTKITILQKDNQILSGVDKDVSTELSKHLAKLGVEIIYDASTTKYNEKEGLTYLKDGKENKIKADLYLVAVGRTPATEDIQNINLKFDQWNGVIVDEHMRTNIKNVYAIGDVTGQNLLAHVAYGHALVAVADILNHENIVYKKTKPVPACIYTTPEIAFVGLTEEQAKAKGHNCFTSKYAFAYLGKAIAAKQTDGFIKLIVDREYGQILGAYIIGPNATDYIAEIILAMEQEVSVKELTYTIHPHPTFSEIVWEAARSVALKLELESKKK